MARRRLPADGHDASRREFFRTFSRQTVQNAGAVAGAASELRRTSLAAARQLLDLDPVASTDPSAATRSVITPVEPATLPDPSFRSAYRLTDDSLVMLDQRELPARVITFACREPSEIASAMRTGAVNAGPVCAEVAAYAIVLAAARVIDRAEESRDQVIKAAAGTLRGARREVHALSWAVDRMEARYDALANAGVSGAEIHDGLRAEADAIALEATAAHAAIGRSGAEAIAASLAGPGQGEGTINLLMHGDSGPLSCGLLGMATVLVQELVDQGNQVHVWVTDGAPSGEGTRVTAFQLTQLDVVHTVIPDTAVGWLFANRTIDAVLLRGDTVCSNGDTTALIGARAVAQVAFGGRAPVYVLAPESSWDRRARDAQHLKLDLRSAAELASARRARLNPPLDVVPARLVSAYVSERAVVRPPFKEPRH